MVFSTLVAATLQLDEKKVSTAIEFFDDGATVPFIARYRKDATGGLDEVELRDIQHRYEYFKELSERKETVIKTIEEQGLLTPELRKQIDTCVDKVKLEDIYLPYKPKKRTRATIAKEAGLEPLARIIEAQEPATNTAEEIARIFLNEDAGITSPKSAIAGALDILAEEFAENAVYRQYLRDIAEKEGQLISVVRKEFKDKKSKFENYYEFSEPVAKIPSHRVLAIRRGDKEKVLRYSISIDGDKFVSWAETQAVKADGIWAKWLKECVADAFDRLMKPSIETEVRVMLKNRAEEEAFKVFEKNMADVLLAAPGGAKTVLALDPGFRSGCKVAVIDATGKFLDHSVIYPHTGGAGVAQSGLILKNMISQHKVQVIAIGNGTASRETDAFAAKTLKGMPNAPIRVVVSEAGASVYSASDIAREEFPDLDITTRGAISIARRLQDPLAELVKVEPKAIGVGQYQHDVNQSKLKKHLDEAVEGCVNGVGVDLNQASAPLLSYVAGITKTIAKKIVAHRDSKGAFKSRKEVLDVAGFGPKAFEQAAGFLRVTSGENPLDYSSVHPENYALVADMAKDLELDIKSLVGNVSEIKKLDRSKYLSDSVGVHTLEDLLGELEKPGRDPRAEFRYAEFDDKIQSIDDLITDSWMEGVVTNVTNFGAFVDVGVHQDGLVHVSEMTNDFVEDAKTVIKVGDIVRVRVTAVDSAQKRIALSMKTTDVGSRSGGKSNNKKDEKVHIKAGATIADLKAQLSGKEKSKKKQAPLKKPAISMKSLMRKGR
jgi:protein Tex